MRTQRIMEYIWLLFSVASLISLIDAYEKAGVSRDFWFFIVFFIISFFMYLFRKKQRIQSRNNSKK
jgi:hypothetical protein